jgi:hypothetical protein
MNGFFLVGLRTNISAGWEILYIQVVLFAQFPKKRISKIRQNQFKTLNIEGWPRQSRKLMTNLMASTADLSSIPHRRLSMSP